MAILKEVEDSLFALLGLFILELLLLFYLSKSLTNSLAKFIFAITRSKTATIYILAFIFLPGTIIHELAHLLTAGVLFVPTGEIELFPEIEEDRVRLGSAQIGQTDLLRRVIIGMAPVALGLGLIVSVLFLLKDGLLVLNSWQSALVFYIIFIIGNTMYSSKKDLEGAVALILVLFVVISGLFAGLYFSGYLLSTLSILDGLNSLPLREFLSKVNYYLGVPIALDIIFISLAKLFTFKRLSLH